MPILLALFFLESSLLFGLVFFTGVVGIGFLERKVLQKLYLLAVPRLSIIMTMVVILLTACALIFSQMGVFNKFTPTLFPIIITTVFIEKFSIMLEEEGTLNTLKVITNTSIIAITIFFLLKLPGLQVFVYTYPELLLISVAAQILIGKYTGYRLTELFRFKDFFKTR